MSKDKNGHFILPLSVDEYMEICHDPSKDFMAWGQLLSEEKRPVRDIHITGGPKGRKPR